MITKCTPPQFKVCMEDVLYYESHITIEPCFDERLSYLKDICKKYSFKVADLLMKKRKEDTPERSAYDTFCTGRSKHFEDIASRMRNLLSELTNFRFKVYRYKIEGAYIDSKIDPSFYTIEEK